MVHLPLLRPENRNENRIYEDLPSIRKIIETRVQACEPYSTAVPARLPTGRSLQIGNGAQHAD